VTSEFVFVCIRSEYIPTRGQGRHTAVGGPAWRGRPQDLAPPMQGTRGGLELHTPNMGADSTSARCGLLLHTRPRSWPAGTRTRSWPSTQSCAGQLALGQRGTLWLSTGPAPPQPAVRTNFAAGGKEEKREPSPRRKRRCSRLPNCLQQ
jgi:hypothetical protein